MTTGMIHTARRLHHLAAPASTLLLASVATLAFAAVLAVLGVAPVGHAHATPTHAEAPAAEWRDAARVFHAVAEPEVSPAAPEALPTPHRALLPAVGAPGQALPIVVAGSADLPLRVYLPGLDARRVPLRYDTARGLHVGELVIPPDAPHTGHCTLRVELPDGVEFDFKLPLTAARTGA